MDVIASASATATDGCELWCWRHPSVRGAAGLCLGAGTDLAVDARKAKRLAHRIRVTARRHGLPACVWTSPLRRAHAVGAWLRRWGWQHRIDARLSEVHFGTWDGQPWQRVPKAALDTWAADLLHHAPGGGESLQALSLRVCAFVAEAAGQATPRLVVTHGGWLNAWRCVAPHTQVIAAADWPAAPPYGHRLRGPLRCGWGQAAPAVAQNS
jgi:alpha-ribazole phosphatase